MPVIRRTSEIGGNGVRTELLIKSGAATSELVPVGPGEPEWELKPTAVRERPVAFTLLERSAAAQRNVPPRDGASSEGTGPGEHGLAAAPSFSTLAQELGTLVADALELAVTAYADFSNWSQRSQVSLIIVAGYVVTAVALILWLT